MHTKESNTPVSEWPEAKPPKGEPGPIYGFRRGYRVREAGKHENADQYASFQKFLLLQGERTLENVRQLSGHSVPTLSSWSKTFNWQKRAAAYDKDQMAIVWKQAEKMQQNSHKEAIVEFRESSERQARMMARVSEDLLRVLGKRIAKAEEEGEEVPMALVSGLLRSAANISEQSRQSWANALGVNEMLEMVEAEMNKIDVEDVTDVDAYDIPLDE
jgi:hypothetical protein